MPCIRTLRLEVRSALLRLLITHRRDLPERTRERNTSWNDGVHCCCVCLSEAETFRRIGAAVRVEQLPSVGCAVVLHIVLEVCGRRDSVSCSDWNFDAGNCEVQCWV